MEDCLWDLSVYKYCTLCRSILPGLRACATDDDVAVHLIKHIEDFDKYLHYMVGQAQAEACVTDKATQQYFKVSTNFHFSINIKYINRTIEDIKKGEFVTCHFSGVNRVW